MNQNRKKLNHALNLDSWAITFTTYVLKTSYILGIHS
jgi:hypothetical protein